MKVGVLLSGSGVYDGTEIHEAVLTLLALDKLDAEVQCIAPDIEQHHVINHMTGEEMPEKRNVLIESSRIARGNIKPLSEVSADDFDALAIPGGFGAAKNHTKWAFSGPKGDINPEVKALIVELIKKHKPIAALCMSPTTLAKALEGTGVEANLTVGTTEAPSPYDIEAISEGMDSLGAKAVYCDTTHVIVDDTNNLVTTPCYMMEASVSEVFIGIEKAMTKLVEMANLHAQS
ncbi:isoprenoid biosynthesis glyoxalase ElbB [Flammeovirgaceae bacterium SG7u.111]|nr:isoprenoid biosynthesis glyoxalase ElbB [Flammeovirgaceae bacterium SG7u.132]WPO38547.1 isoprenoid biosynthesis glyoxalase ElbB [Flammeovirgaceae bacterium SG7u.111]